MKALFDFLSIAAVLCTVGAFKPSPGRGHQKAIVALPADSSTSRFRRARVTGCTPSYENVTIPPAGFRLATDVETTGAIGALNEAMGPSAVCAVAGNNVLSSTSPDSDDIAKSQILNRTALTAAGGKYASGSMECVIVCPVTPEDVAVSSDSEVVIGDVTTGALPHKDIDRVCAQLNYPLDGKWITAIMAGDFTYEDDGVSNGQDSVKFKLGLTFGLKLDIVVVQLALTVTLFADIEATLPASVSGPLERVVWVLEVLVDSVFSHSKLMSYFVPGAVNNDKYIKEVVSGIGSLKTDAKECPRYSVPSTENPLSLAVGTCTVEFHIAIDGCDEKKNAECNTELGVCFCSKDGFPCANTAEKMCYAKVANSLQGVNIPPQILANTFQEMHMNYVASLDDACASLKKIKTSWLEYDHEQAEHVLSSVYCAENGDNGAHWSASSSGKLTRVMQDAAAFAIADDKPVQAYTFFLASHFSARMLAHNFDFGNGNKWSGALKLNCKIDPNPEEYMKKRIHTLAGVSQASVHEAMERMCVLMSTGAIVPPSKREDENSLFFRSLHANKNFLHSFTVLMPELFQFTGPSLKEWIRNGAPTGAAPNQFNPNGKILLSLGAGGGKISTFTHMMAIISGTPETVRKQLTKYLKALDAKTTPKQTCTTGISKVQGGVTLKAAVGNSGAGNVCDPGAAEGEELGVAVTLAGTLVSSATRGKKAPCALSSFGPGEESAQIGVYLSNVVFSEKKFTVEIKVNFQEASKDWDASISFMVIDETCPEDSESDTTTQKAIAAALTALRDTLIAAFNHIVLSIQSSSTESKMKIASTFVTNLLNVGYTAIGVFIESGEEGALDGLDKKVRKNALGSKVSAFVEKYTKEFTTKVAGLIGDTTKAMGVKKKMPEKECSHGIELALDSKLTLDIHYKKTVQKTMEMSSVSGASGAAYEWTTYDDTVFTYAHK